MFTLNNQQINVPRTLVLDAIKSGLERHRKEYQEALSDYQEATKQFFASAHERTEKGDFTNLNFNLVPPRNYEEDYLVVMGMLEVSSDDIVSLDQSAYNAYFRGKWKWAADFTNSAMAYKSVLGSLSR